jgi:hypothetical protein
MRRKRRSDLTIVLSLMLALLAATTPVTRAQSGVNVTLKDASLNIPVGSSRQMTATVTGAANTTVNWSVNNIAGGNASIGTISSTGNYISPANIAVGTVLTIKATSVADANASATCTITIRNQIPYITGVTPNPLPVPSL